MHPSPDEKSEYSGHLFPPNAGHSDNKRQMSLPVWTPHRKARKLNQVLWKGPSVRERMLASCRPFRAVQFLKVPQGRQTICNDVDSGQPMRPAGHVGLNESHQLGF